MTKNIICAFFVCKENSSWEIYDKNTTWALKKETEVVIDREHGYITMKIIIIKDTEVFKVYYVNLGQIYGIRNNDCNPIIINVHEFVMRIKSCDLHCYSEKCVKSCLQIKMRWVDSFIEDNITVKPCPRSLCRAYIEQFNNLKVDCFIGENLVVCTSEEGVGVITQFWFKRVKNKLR